MIEEIKEYTLKFHNTYERLAPNYGYETRKDTKEFDFNSNNGKLMYATVSEIISPLLQKVEQLEKENERLNNIINELEKWLIEQQREEGEFCDFFLENKQIKVEEVLDKLKELKDDNK